MMHKLLKRQLKKITIDEELFENEQFQKLLEVVNQAYKDEDEDRKFLEQVLKASSSQRQKIYEKLEKESQDALKKSESKYTNLVQNLNNHYFFYTHGADGIFTYLSDSITNILGYTVDEFCKHYTEYLTDDPINQTVEHYTNLSLSGLQQKPYQLSIFHKDGSARYLEVTEIPVFDEHKNVIFIDGIARDITQQQQTQKKLLHLAKYDVLTSLVNRAHLEEAVENLILKTKRSQTSFALLFLDLDHFKHINDTLGHHIGDKLLQEVANRILPNIREEDIFARIGGDEFIIVITDITEVYLTTIINKIMSLMRKTWNIEAMELKVSTSMGIALYPQDAKTMIDLMKNADIAMYKAKALGRDNFSFFTEELNEKVHQDMRLEQDMVRALASNQFELYYQAKLNTSNNAILGCEALIRWNHPDFGLIYPDKFIELAESTGFIVKLGRWIIDEGCRFIKRFNTKYPEHKLQLSLNVSIRQLQNDDTCSIIQESLEDTKIDPNQLAIEITESIMADHSEKMITQLKTIKKLGVSIYLDDFGTGYSSLSYLHRLPIDVIKIDKTFLDEIPQNTDQKILLDVIVAMGETLGFQMIAEGVEEEYQRQYLINLGCLSYQGYLFSKAVTEEEFYKLLN